MSRLVDIWEMHTIEMIPKSMILACYSKSQISIFVDKTTIMVPQFSNHLKSSSEVENAKDYERKFEQHAISLLEMANEKDHELTHLLLVRTVDAYGNLSLLDIAVNGQSRAFIATPMVQRVLKQIWWGRISNDDQHLKDNKRGFMFTLFCPLLAPKLLAFDGAYSNFDKVKCFMNSPRTIYAYTVLFYIAFIIIFAFFLTMNVCHAPSAGTVIV